MVKKNNAIINIDYRYSVFFNENKAQAKNIKSQ